MSETPTKPRPLTRKQKLFVEEYVATGNGTRAAIAAGHSTLSARTIAQENLTKPAVVAAIRELTKDADESRIATAKERQEFFTRMMKSEDVPYRDRIRAAELLGKAQGDFIERREIIKRAVDQMDSEELLQYKISLEEKRAVVLQMKTRALPKIESSKLSNIIDVESIEAAK